MRYIDFYVYNSDGKRIFYDNKFTGLNGVVICSISTVNWSRGIYSLKVEYPRNDWPAAVRYVKLHMI